MLFLLLFSYSIGMEREPCFTRKMILKASKLKKKAAFKKEAIQQTEASLLRKKILSMKSKPADK